MKVPSLSLPEDDIMRKGQFFSKHPISESLKLDSREQGKELIYGKYDCFKTYPLRIPPRATKVEANA
jgi:hypothetical protein